MPKERKLKCGDRVVVERGGGNNFWNPDHTLTTSKRYVPGVFIVQENKQRLVQLDWYDSPYDHERDIIAGIWFGESAVRRRKSKSEIKAEEREIRMKKELTYINWKKYPMRKCRSMHECYCCRKTIRDGEIYYDGGFNRRAHQSCALRQAAKLVARSVAPLPKKAGAKKKKRIPLVPPRKRPVKKKK